MSATSRRQPLRRASPWLAGLLLACAPWAGAGAQGFVPAPLTAEIRTLDRCLDVPGFDRADHVPLQMFGCNGGLNQRWLVRFDFAGFAILESKSTGKCLDVPSETSVQQFRCHGGDNQRWQLRPDPETLRFRLVPKTAPGRCLHVRESDNRMDLAACDRNPAAVRQAPERWARENFELRLKPDFEPLFEPLINEGRQSCLDVAGLRQDDSAPVQQFPCNDGGNQRWLISRRPDGFYLLQAQHSRKCLRSRSGGGVEQATCDATQDRQKWYPQLTSTGRVRLQTKQPQCHLIPCLQCANPSTFCECLSVRSDGSLRVGPCTQSADLWRVGTGRRAPGAITFFEHNGLGGDRLCGLAPAAGEFRFEQPGARACENDEARSLLLYEVAAGTVIDVFDDGRCRTTDDHTKITVKDRRGPHGAAQRIAQGVTRYELNSFERGFEDDFLKVERLTTGNLDGKVSCVRITPPG